MKFLYLLIPVLLLGGCATAPRPIPAVDPGQSWQRHSEALKSLHDWRLTGRMAIQTEDEGWHASLDWHQEGDAYDIHLSGPLGGGSVRLTGNEQWVELQKDDGQRVSAADPEWLLYRQLGWRVPVSALRYWVLGLPAPGQAEWELDPYGHLSLLRQGGWEIRFLDYRREQRLELPGRVFMSNQRAQVRLVVGRWELNPDGRAEEDQG